MNYICPWAGFKNLPLLTNRHHLLIKEIKNLKNF